jgi:hypothetical protein
MRRRLLAVIAASLSLIGSSMAAAAGAASSAFDPALGYDSPRASVSNEDWSRLVSQQVAACLLRKHPAAVLKAIREEPWEPNASRTLADALDPNCLGTAEVVMPPDLFRGALYQLLYREHFASKAPTLPPAPPSDFTAAMTSNLTEEAKAQLALRQFGDCVVRRDLADANTLILTVPGSDQENNALAALMPHLSACLSAGMRWTLTRGSISGLLSEVIYREATAADGEARK